MNEHTPTPWEIRRGESPMGEFFVLSSTGRGPGRSRILATVDGNVATLDGLGAKANAEFIVRAVNCHDDLVQACRDLCSLVFEVTAPADELRRAGISEPSPGANIARVERARALIAKAEAEP